MNKTKIKTLIRFLNNVDDQTSNCWLWKASKYKNGYGQFFANGKPIKAHRFSYQFFKGFIQNGLQLDHLCRIRHCVNPDHLEIVTQQENIKRGMAGKLNNYLKKKTHCKNGHLLSGSNLLPYYLKHGKRACRVCVNIRNRKRYVKSTNIIKFGGSPLSNKIKTHCLRGHLLDENNLVKSKTRNNRQCKICQCIRSKEYRDRKKLINSIRSRVNID